jgi:glycerol-3-phosphate acyltransferase PlsY
MTLAAMAVVAYLVSSVPFALLLARWSAGIDIRRTGSGNLGAANVARSGGVGLALIVMVLDAGKGALAVCLADCISPGATGQAIASVAAVIGHTRPVWIAFRGGKGVATTAGAFAVIAPLAVLGAAGVFVAAVWATRYVSLGSILAAGVLPLFVYLAGVPDPAAIAAITASAIVLERHRGNVARLVGRTERRLGQRG